jgi:hypothetical protein
MAMSFALMNESSKPLCRISPFFVKFDLELSVRAAFDLSDRAGKGWRLNGGHSMEVGEDGLL